MRDEQLVDEDAYFAVREEQLVRRLERAGYTRRTILKRGAVGAMLLAGAARLASPGRARAASTARRPAAPSGDSRRWAWPTGAGSRSRRCWSAPASVRAPSTSCPGDSMPTS